MKTRAEAWTQAVEWVADEIEKQTCISDVEAVQHAAGFVSGVLHGLRVGSMGHRIAGEGNDPTAENYWRRIYIESLEWDRHHVMGIYYE